MTDCFEDWLMPQEEDYANITYGTTELFRRSGRNEAYLFNKTNELDDATDPNLRKREAPILIDIYKSYGVVQNGQNITFNPSLVDQFTENFNLNNDDPHLGRIDKRQTTCYVSAGQHKASLVPLDQPEELNASYLGPYANMSCNTHWYVGFSPHDNYVIPTGAKLDKFGYNFKTTIRAQSFLSSDAGYITRVMVPLEAHPQPEDDLWIEIRTMANGKPSNNILCREKVDKTAYAFTEKMTVQLQNPVLITSNTEYAIVLRSPFTSYAKHWGLGGWQIGCIHTTTQAYANGDAYTSEDNGHTWIKHGKTDLSLVYKEGRIMPVNYGFEVYTKPLTDYSTTMQYLYFLAFRTNPTKTVNLVVSQTTPSGTTIAYEVCNDMSVSTPVWIPVPIVGNTGTITLSDQTKSIIYIRAKLQTSGTSPHQTPTINSIIVSTTNNQPLNAYIRTLAYNPKLTNFLGASIWAEANAPVQVDAGASCKVDIIKDTINTYSIYTDGTINTFVLPQFPANPMVDCVEYLDNPTGNSGTTNQIVQGWLEGVNYQVNYDTKTVTFKTNPPAGTIKFKFYGLVIKGLTSADFPFKLDLQKEDFTFATGQTTYQLKVPPVCPLRKVTCDGIEGYEWSDFEVNYDTGLVTVYTTHDGSAGEIKYTPNIQDSGLAFAYYLSRPDVSKSIQVEPNWLTFRV